MDLDEKAAIKEYIITCQRELHKIPGIGFELKETVKFVTKELESMGIPYRTICNGSAILGQIGGGKGRVIGIAADMDGLPIREEVETPYKSTYPNCMHACGHDFHTATLLGVARLMQENKEHLKGTVKLIFRCNEEGLQGAKVMIEEGALDNPKPDRIIGFHCASTKLMPSGCFGYKFGTVSAAAYKFKLIFKGQGGHASTPHENVASIGMGCRMVEELNRVSSAEINTTIPAVITVSGFNSGGEAFNVVPDQAELIGTVRTTNEETGKFIGKRIQEIGQSISYSHRGNFEMEWEFLCPALKVDEKSTEQLIKAAKECGYDKVFFEIPSATMGSDDFAEFLKIVPGAMFFLNLPKLDENGECFPPHSSKFQLDETNFEKAAILIAQYALDYINKSV